MRQTGKLLGLVLATALVSAGAQARADGQTPPDNTRVNRANRSVSADQQKNNRSDVETTRQIRRALVADKTLSTSAHNVKVITQDGKVTLKGPVRSGDEKQKVEAKAVEIAGATNVTDQISVMTSSSKTTSKSRKTSVHGKE